MMKDSDNIFGRRLNQARVIKGITMEELGQMLSPSVSRQAINKYEKGQTMPDSRMLIAFAKALSVKPDFFFRPFTVAVEKIMFQKKTSLSDKAVSSIRERVREELERYLEIEQLCGCARDFKLAVMDIVEEEQALEYARIVRAELGLGVDGISNVIEVLEENGVKVIEIDEAESFGGLSGYVNNTIPVIVVNRNMSSENKRFTLLHELGHLVLKFHENVAPKGVENICNIFASELLLPAPVLVSRLGNSRHDISLTELSSIQQQYGISVDCIMLSLKRLRVISSRRYSVYLCKKKNFSEFNSLVERSLALQESSSRFVRIVYRAVADELISLSKAAALLNISVDSVKARLQLV